MSHRGTRGIEPVPAELFRMRMRATPAEVDLGLIVLGQTLQHPMQPFWQR
jgi:hypothetical protein